MPGEKQEWDFQLGAGEQMKVTEAMKEMFDKHGLIVVRNLFDADESAKLRSAAEHKNGLTQHAFRQADSDKGDPKRRDIEMVLWNHPGDDVTGMLARVPKMITTMEQLMGCKEMYHWHSWMNMKHAKTGGAHIWHQDYEYWYREDAIYPDMGTVLIAIDSCTPQNGCLEVLPGSHLCGRVEHITVGDQLYVEHTRVEMLQDHFGTYHVPIDPGDAIFKHANLVHRAPQNHDDTRRWVYGVAYSDIKNKYPPQYKPLKKVDDDSIKRCCNYTDLTGKVFVDDYETDPEQLTTQ